MKCFSVLLVMAAVSTFMVEGRSQEDRLVTRLQQQLGTTGSIARPIPNGNVSQQVTLSLGLSLLRVASLMSKDSSAELDVWIQMFWKDPRLSWNPEDFGGLRSVALPSDMLWIPDVRPFHAGSYKPDRVSPVRVVVKSSSDVTYVLPAVLRAPCSRLRNGSVKCRPILGSWVYSSSELNTTLSDKPFDLDDFEQLEKWTVAQATVERVEAFYPCCPESYISAKYTIVFNPRRGSKGGKKSGKHRQNRDD